MYKALGTGAIGVKADLAQAAALAQHHRFAGVYVDVREVRTLGVERARQVLREAGVRAAGFGLPVDYRLAEPEFAAALAELEALAPLAAALDITRTSTWVPSWHDERDFAANYAFHVDRFGRIARVLRRHGIRLGLEFLGPKHLRDGHPYAFIHTMDGMLQLARDIGTGNVGLLFDAFHWYTSGGVPADIARLSDADIVDVHVNDAIAGAGPEEQQDQVRALPGETGVIDLVAFLRGLAQIGYSGPVMVEPFSQRVRSLPPEEAVRVTAEALDKVWREAGLA